MQVRNTSILLNNSDNFFSGSYFHPLLVIEHYKEIRFMLKSIKVSVFHTRFNKWNINCRNVSSEEELSSIKFVLIDISLPTITPLAKRTSQLHLHEYIHTAKQCN